MKGIGMIDIESNHYEIVADALCGRRDADEQTFASLGILSERLERLAQLGGAFSAVEFSPAVKELIGQENALPIA